MADSYRMRVRVKQPLSGCIDGIQLHSMVVGREYDVGVSLACYLMAIEAVDLVVDADDAWTAAPERRGKVPVTSDAKKN